jgi:glycine betaine/proline transport system ATP-binding protein
MPLPVPVTDADGELVGVVPRATLLAALGTQNGSDEQPTDASVEDWPEPVDTGIIDRVLAEADDAVSPQAAGERSDR